MKVLMLKDVRNVGRKGEIVEVSEGYARNALYPKKFAIPADQKVIEKVKIANEQKEFKKELHLNQIKDLFKRVEDTTIFVKEKANEKGHLFASINKEKIKDLLKKEFGADFETSWIKSDEHIKSLGEHKIELDAFGIKSIVSIQVDSI